MKMDFIIDDSHPTLLSEDSTETNTMNTKGVSDFEIDFTRVETDPDFTAEIVENTTNRNLFQDITKFASDFAHEIKNDPNHGYLLLSIMMAIIWSVYIILYNSRVMGHILTAVLRRFIKSGDIRIGSISISLLWGKLMFRDILFVTEDYSLRVVDAIVQFHYWVPYLKKELHEDMSKCDHRLWIELNGAELHIYNRSNLYSKLEEIFGLDPQVIPKKEKETESPNEKEDPSVMMKDMSFWSSWRDLIPVIKVDLNMARFVFGNNLIPSTLLLTMDKAECIYSTKPPACHLDFFMHVVRAKSENFRVILAPSPKYTGLTDEPPRFMGEGFVVMSSSKILFYYYMDEAGLVPETNVDLLIEEGEESAPPPVWGIDIKCEKGTNLSYGPWADRQREQLFKFFFPQDYQKILITKQPKSGTVRQAQQFDIRLTIQTEATIDILFSKEKETNAVHMNVQRGSYFEMTLPWLVKKEGYVIRIMGQFLYLDASTSLQYRNLIEAESLTYEVNVKYPLIWNKHQAWDMNFQGSKVSYHFIYGHKHFFHDLIEDWSSKMQPDILHFVPYTWCFNFSFKQFELITLANEYNWIDCSSQHQANAHVAFCGEAMDLKFKLPFVTFLPEVVPLKFSVKGRSLFLSLFLPPTNTTSNIIAALDADAKLQGNTNRRLLHGSSWRKCCKLSSGWIDCWQVPELELTLGYTYHPLPPMGPSPQANVSTPEKMEILLSPIRAPHRKKTSIPPPKKVLPENFDPSLLASDTFTVDLKICQPSELKLFGSILRLFIHLKENIFGEDQTFIDMSEPNPFESEEGAASSKQKGTSEESVEEFDGRKFRPFEVTVNIDIRNVRGHLMKNCSGDEPPCPVIAMDRLIFEMNKKYKETKMQVVLSPIILTTVDNTARYQFNSHLQQGFLLLSGFQMRGHAMFSDKGRPLGEDTLEYSWLVELTVGSLSGKLTAPQLHHILTGLETFFFTAFDSENCLRHPRPYNLCYHGHPQPDCPHTLPDHFCPVIDVIKYKMFRVSVDAIDFHLVEVGTDLNLQVYPIRIATCNLHGQHTRRGVTAYIENVRMRNLVCGWVGSRDSHHHSNETDGVAKAGEASSVGDYSGVGVGTCGSGGTAGTSSATVGTVGGVGDVWIEAATVVLGPLCVDAAVSSTILHHDMQLIQHRFLKLHDQKTHRLWFLWPKETTKSNQEKLGKCGCVGGCNFFGCNRNGKRFFKPGKQDFIEGINVAQFRVNDRETSPGYAQSILHEDQLVFDWLAYSGLTRCQYGSTSATDREQLNLSSGYTKSTSPAAFTADPKANRDLNTSNSSIHPTGLDSSGDSTRNPSKTSQLWGDNAFETSHPTPESKPKLCAKGILNGRTGESNSLGRPINKEATSALCVPTGEFHGTPSSLLDLRLSVDNVHCSSANHYKMPSSLSLQTELPLQRERKRPSLNGAGEHEREEKRPPVTRERESPSESIFHRTISVGSEALSEAFYSADEDQMQVASRRGGSLSPTSSLISLPAVPEMDMALKKTDPFEDSGHPDVQPTFLPNVKAKSTNSSSESIHSKSSTSSINSSRSSSTTCDYRNGSFGHSQTSLLHSTESDGSKDHEVYHPQPKVKLRKKSRSKNVSGDYFSEGGSVSSNSFISALSSQEDIAMVDLHVQLNKPITESPLLMTSYVNHMTQLRCHNWDSPPPNFEREKMPSAHMKRLAPTFEKLSVGFTAIRMVEGVNYCPPPKSPPPLSNNTPSHPYSWDTPIFTWGDIPDGNQEELTEAGSAILESNTTRTSVVIKLKKDVDFMVSPIALESIQRFVETRWSHPRVRLHSPKPEINTIIEQHIHGGRHTVAHSSFRTHSFITAAREYAQLMVPPPPSGFPKAFPRPFYIPSTMHISGSSTLEVLTPVVESLHPLTIVNRAHFKSVSKVEAKNTLKKDRYMYWSKLRDGKKCGTPEQAPVVSSTYEESCFQKVQGHVNIPRINVSLLQASVVEEVISFSALDNIRDLTCVSLFSVCLDGVHLQFYSGHQSKQAVQIFMRNPKVSGKPKKTKPKAKLNLDLFTEPVYIETSEKQQEENMISVNVNKLHVQLRRLKNESSLLKDASITAIPNHRSKVMFTFRRCDWDDDVDDHTEEGLNVPFLNSLGIGGSHPDDERMGFIMFEAGLENVALKAVKRKGFGNQLEVSTGSKAAEGNAMFGENAFHSPHATQGGKDSSSIGSAKGTRTSSAPGGGLGMRGSKGPPSSGNEQTPSNDRATTSGAASGQAGVGTPYNARKHNNETDSKHPYEHHSTSPSQGSNATAHSTSIIKKDDSQIQSVDKSDKKDITSFSVELSIVWFNFAAPPHAPITRKIDYTRLDWNFLSTASPSINAWMNPSDRLTVAIIHFLHSSECRCLGLMASLMAEALDVQSIHVAPKNKYSKLMPLSQTIQEDPSCQLCNVLRRFVLQSSLQHIESNLTHAFLPKLAILRQGVVVLSRQWKSALYMPLLMEQTFKVKQEPRVVPAGRPSQADAFAFYPRSEGSKAFLEEKASLIHNGKESPLSNINEEIKNNARFSEEEETDGVLSSSSSHLPHRQPLPSFPPRSATTSAIIPLSHPSHESPVRKFHFPNLGMMLEETFNFFRGSSHLQESTHKGGLRRETWQGSFSGNKPLATGMTIPSAFNEPPLLLRPKSKESIREDSARQSLVSVDGECPEFETSCLPKEDFYKWMAKQQEHNQQSQDAARHTVTFNKGLDLPILSEGSEMDFDETADLNPISAVSHQPPNVILEPQPAHFLEAHVIFEPLLSAIGVITQQVTGGALEQLGANIAVTGGLETFRMDIIESEASRLNRKKRKTGLHPGKFYLDIGGEVPSFICEKMGLEIDIRKVPDESRGWVCQQPTLIVSRSALKQHTSTRANFSLNVNYIAQQVNMPLLRLLHQIASMYQNARDTQIGLKEQRPSKTKNTATIPTNSKDSYSELHEGEYKATENSLSLSEEQATLSSTGGIKGQRGSVVSSASARESPPVHPTSTAVPPHGSQNKFGRPHSFAQKLKSSTKMSKGYMNLVLEREKGAHSPLLNHSISGSGLEGVTLCSDRSPLLEPTEVMPTTPPGVATTPKCWRNIYYLVDLYATTPETKTVQQRPGMGTDAGERYKASSLKLDPTKDSKHTDVEAGLRTSSSQGETSILTDKIKDSGYFLAERTPLVIHGTARIQKTKLLATISGLKLEAEMNAMSSSIAFQEKVKGSTHRSSSEMTFEVHVGNTMIVLLEGIAPSQQTVVRMTISTSHGVYSSLFRRSKNKNSTKIVIGPVQIDIPQHPIILHDMMTRGTKQLSSTLQELRVARPSRLSRGTTFDEPDIAPSPRLSQSKTPEPADTISPHESLLHPLTIQFSIRLQEMSIHAALLPSLQATYCMQQVSSEGVTGAKANFKIHLSRHHLAFTTKIQDLPGESSLPPSAKISLPKVQVEAQYIHDDSTTNEFNSADGMVLTEGNYLSAVAEIGSLEHSLTTDLLNHLVFVQKVFMKEVNEVVQKMAGSDKPVPLWSEEGSGRPARSQGLLLFNIQVKLKGIIITATTPTQSAVRLETGTVELQLSNRVENMSKPSKTSTANVHHPKIFGKADVEITLALGQLIRNDLFDEIEPHFQQLAYFRTRIGLRNAFHDELSSIGEEGEMVLITLTRPLICIQPLAVDKAVLVWLNYKNAYEYWNEQRATLNKEVLAATQQVFEKVPQFPSLSSATHMKSTLFLKLTVSDIGLCLPLNPCRTISHQVDSTETRDALVVTLASTIISACNSGSLVCKAQFRDFCTRFAPEFETSLDEWKPDYRDRSIMNLCKVSEGTYEVCSRTVAQSAEKGENAKWLLNVHWQMEGVELHFDVNIGKHLSSLARTLTMLTGAPGTGNVPSSTDYDSDEGENADHTPQESGNLPAFIFDVHMDPRQRAKLLEVEMNEQAKTVNDLKVLGASPLTIEQEVQRLKELEQIVSNDFRRDVLMKIRRQSIKATSMKDRLGLGPKLHMRSKSFRIPSPTVEVKEPMRHCSIASGSTDSYVPGEDADVGDVFVTSSSEMTLPLGTPPHRVSNSPGAGVSKTEVESLTSFRSESEDSRKGTFPGTPRPRQNSPPRSFPRQQDTSTQSGTPSAPIFKAHDPTIDLELDVKVCINSGECILYNEDFSKKKEKEKEEEIKGRAELKKSAGKMKNMNQSTPSVGFDITGFFIPGLDVKVHYESHNTHSDTPLSTGKGGIDAAFAGHFPGSSSAHSYDNDPDLSPWGNQEELGGVNRVGGPFMGAAPPLRRGHTKRASLFMWLTLQSIPEETMISPSILDFMEKVLEPIPMPEPTKNGISSPISTEPEMTYSEDFDSCISGGPITGGYSYASFPVDVIVYFHMKPSTIRFSSQPVLRVECLLKLPSLNLIFSSKRAKESDHQPDGNVPSTSGGLSVTGALEDFSLFVFHPYGSKNATASSTPVNPLSESERKDFLSVMVEFVKFHLSRSRKISFSKQEPPPKPFIKTGQSSDVSKAIIRFSTIIDIGAAHFKYDMRHITEILAFPRAWYRRTLVRRLFLGDMTSRTKDSHDRWEHSTPQPSKSSSTVGGDNARWSGSSHASNAQVMTPPSQGGGLKTDHNLRKEKTRRNSEAEALQLSPKTSGARNHEGERTGSWETLVQFAVNFTKLNVHMNMRNVMGHAVWTTKDFRANGRLSIGSTGHKNLYIGLGLGGSCLEAKGGIVGGIIELTEINMYLKIREDPYTEPDHVIGIKLFASQSRLDYMGTSVLMGRVSSFGLTLRDEWKLKQCAKEEDDTTRRGATIFIIGDVEWDQLHLLINKSTTADLLKMYNRLQEFFSQQFNSSRLVFSSFQDGSKGTVKPKDRQAESNRKLQNILGVNLTSDGRHHRHWQRVLSRVSGLRLTTLPLPLPVTGTVLGGSLELHGKTIFLACFHGMNFKSKSWALFSLKEPYIIFTSEVQDVPGETSQDTHIVQNLTFSLGILEQTQAQHVSMAKVCRITRNMVFPPQFRNLQEWFHYACCTSDLDDVDRFPTLDGTGRGETLASTSSGDSKRSSSRLSDHNHSSETIFALPSLEVHHTSKHLQTALTPDITDKKPVVECSLVTEFQDHIFVTIDAENFFFLHDLINSYIKDTREKMASKTKVAMEGDSKDGEKGKPMKVNEPTQILQQDWRDFTCTTWHLEPTVRLLSWATRNLEPYGVDFILNKLGFSHARTTIPKWLQRGCMDPLDKVLSVLLYRLISAIHEHDAANR